MQSTRVFLPEALHGCALFVCVLAALVFVSLSPVPGSASSPDDAAPLVIATSEDSAPLSYLDEKGRPTGLLIDIWSLWARNTGRKIAFRPAPFAETFRDVRTGVAQIQSGCFESPGRRAYLDFATPLYPVHTDVFYQNNLRMRRREDLLGFRVGVVRGDYAIQYLKREIPGVAFRYFDRYEELFSSLKRNELKVFVADRPVALYYLNRLGLLNKFNYDANANLFTRQLYAAVRKGNKELLQAVRKGFQNIDPKALAGLEHKWIGTSRQHAENLLRISCPNEYEPFAMRTITGEAAGMLVDLWRIWAQKTGVKVTFSFSDWADSVRNVLEGECDFHCGMLPVDSDKSLRFGPPTFPMAVKLFALPQKGTLSLSDLTEKKLAVLANTKQEAWLRAKAPHVNLLPFDDVQSMLASVFQGQAAALCNSQVNTHAVLDMNGLTDQLRASNTPLFHDYLHPAVHSGRTGLLELLQSGFKEISNQELLTIEERWIANPGQQLFSHYGRNVRVSGQELERIKALPVLRLGVREDRPPLEFVTKDGKYKGIIPEILHLLHQRFSVSFQPQVSLDWNETLALARDGEIDVLSELPQTPENEKNFIFTQAYFEFPLVVVTRSDSPFFADLAALEGRRMAVYQSPGLLADLKKKYPKINFVPMESYESALREVSAGRTDCCLGGMLALSYLANKLDLENLKIALHTDLVTKLRLAVPKAKKELAVLLDKMLATIPQSRLRKITESWMMIRFEPTINWDYVWKAGLTVAAVAGLILGVILIWNRRLAREINCRRAVEQRLSSMAANVPGALFQVYVRPNGEYGYYYFSKRSEELFGFTEEEAKADPGILRVFSDDAERFRESFEQAVAEVADWNFTGRIQLPDGIIKWINAIATPLRDNTGEIVFNGILLDITERKLVAQKYLETEKKIRAMSDATHDALLMVDSHGVVQFWNPAAEKIFGIPVEEALGIELQALLPSVRSRDYLCNRVLTFLVNEKRLSTEELVQETIAINRNGSEIPVDLAMNSFEVEGVRYVVATVRDISARKEADARIKDQLMFSDALIDTIPNPIFIMDTEARYLGCNRAYEATFGVTRNTIIGKLTEELEHFPEPLRTVLHADELAALSDRKMRHHEIKVPFPNGRKHRLLYWCTAFNLSDGRLAGLINVMVDITAQKRAEQELLILSQAVECSPVSMLLMDREGKIEYANPTFYKRLMLEKSEVIGASYAAFLHARNSAEVLESLQQTMAGGGSWQGDLVGTTRNGENIWESAWFTPVIDAEGEISHYVAVKEDITARKKMEHELIDAKEAAEAATKAKSEFLARMSHEIRTPMNAIMGMAHLALQTNLDDKQLDYVKKIQVSATALLNIINDILDFSKIEAGKMLLEFIEFSLEEVLDSLGSLVSFSAGEKGLELLFNLDPDVPDVLVGDPLRLNQVLINLVNNAVKFTEQGEIIISTKLNRKEDGRVVITFTVRDSGIGLSEEQQGHLFQSFSQADGSTTRKFGGTGLGLAICKRLVDLMDGEIWVESQEDQGSLFSFTAQFGYKENTEDRLLVPPVSLRRLATLVVDDNAMARDILTRTLESFSFVVSSAGSGEDAVHLLQDASADDPYKLVVIDMSMPGLTGLQTAEKIKNTLRGEPVPKVILLTSYSGEEASEGNVSVLLDGILVKPVSRSLLFNTVLDVFGSGRGLVVPQTSSGQNNTLLAVRERLAGACALLVEDNDINQEIAVELIEQAGLRVDVASNGLEAVRAAESKEYDIILMDIQMPEMDGLEAAATIRGLNTPWAKEVPILAMTAHALVGDKEKSLEAGMNAHIVKPIDPDELYEALLHWTRPPESTTGPARSAHQEPYGRQTFGEDLPGLSVRAGLRRVGDNRELYEKLLQRFRSSNADFLFRLQRALAGNDTQSALQMVHTIRGVAGNLGAAELSGAAAGLELILKDGQGAGLEDSVKELESWFGLVMDSIASLVPADAENGHGPTDTGPVDAGAVLGLLDTFETLLDTDISEAQDCLENMCPLLNGSAYEPLCKAMCDRLEAFDIDGALEKSRELREGLSALLTSGAHDDDSAPVPDAALSAGRVLSEEQREAAGTLLQQLADSLENDLPESRVALEQLNPLLESTACAPLLRELAEQLERFDMDGVRKSLEAIALQCGLPPLQS